MDKATFLHTLRAGRVHWDALLARVSDELVDRPGVSGEMSIRDLVAHVTWYEREMVGLLRARALAGSSLWDLPLDQRNAAILRAGRSQAWAEVQAEAQRTFEQLVRALEALPEAALNDAAQFRDMPVEWAPWSVIASNCYEHYSQHLPDVEAWLARTRGDPG